jgi:hypothetical protein
MFYFFLFFALTLYACVFHWVANRKLVKRIRALERDLQSYSSAMSQMAEIQIETHRKFFAGFESLEERMMELSIPSPDSSLPLERRHQVLALARQGLALEDIVKRLKAPIGEAELILNLGKYSGTENTRTAKMNEQVKQYA